MKLYLKFDPFSNIKSCIDLSEIDIEHDDGRVEPVSEYLFNLKAIELVYTMNQEFIQFVKSKITSQGFVTHQDILDYRTSKKSETSNGV